MEKYNQNFKILIKALLVLLPFYSAGQGFSDTAKKLDLLFAELDSTTPGAVLKVSRGKQILYLKGFGMADLESNLPVTDYTIFEAGSVSKQFTAATILVLAQEGKLQLEDPVRKYIPELPDYESPVTIRHLLNHTSGLRDWGALAELGGWPRGTRLYNNQMALNYIIRQEALNHLPGAEYLYSNSNYTLLTIIAERIYGQSLPDITRRLFFIPLGMKNTHWRNNFQELVKNRATGYQKKDDRFFSNMPMENTYGHAALLTTVHDLDIWNRSWSESGIINSKLKEWRLEKGVLNNGQTISYAAGVIISAYAGHPEINHSGATAGYRAWMAYYPDNGLSVVYLSNAGHISTTGTGRAVSEIFYGPEIPKNKTAESTGLPASFPYQKVKLDQWTGQYFSRECGGVFTVKKENDSLFIFDQRAVKRVLIPQHSGSFYSSDQTRYEFRISGGIRQLYITVPRARNVKFESPFSLEEIDF